MNREITDRSDYIETVANLIPSELIAGYLAVAGLAASDAKIEKWILIAAALIVLILIPFYVEKFNQVKTKWQKILTMVAFVIWVYNLGGPFKLFGLYNPVIAGCILIMFTLFVPLFIKPEVQAGDRIAVQPRPNQPQPTPENLVLNRPAIGDLLNKEGQIVSINRLTRSVNVDVDGKKMSLPMSFVNKIK